MVDSVYLEHRTMLAALFSALHLLTLALGLGSVWARGAALKRGDVPAVLRADLWWGVAALAWIGTGLYRAFGGLEKGTDWYLHSPLFAVKMALFGLVFALELYPMITFIGWRRTRGKGGEPSLTNTPTLARVNDVELALTVLIPFVAAAMARGVW
jgi:putative membrane protein